MLAHGRAHAKEIPVSPLRAAGQESELQSPDERTGPQAAVNEAELKEIAAGRDLPGKKTCDSKKAVPSQITERNSKS
jgi:hypothetical protein